MASCAAAKMAGLAVLPLPQLGGRAVAQAKLGALRHKLVHLVVGRRRRSPSRLRPCGSALAAGSFMAAWRLLGVERSGKAAVCRARSSQHGPFRRKAGAPCSRR